MKHFHKDTEKYRLITDEELLYHPFLYHIASSAEVSREILITNLYLDGAELLIKEENQ